MNMYELKSCWVAEYNPEQSCFNVTNLYKAIMANRRITIDKMNNGFQIFGVYKTREEAQEAVNEMKELQK